MRQDSFESKYQLLYKMMKLFIRLQDIKQIIYIPLVTIQ